MTNLSRKLKQIRKTHLNSTSVVYKANLAKSSHLKRRLWVQAKIQWRHMLHLRRRLDKILPTDSVKSWNLQREDLRIFCYGPKIGRKRTIGQHHWPSLDQSLRCKLQLIHHLQLPTSNSTWNLPGWIRFMEKAAKIWALIKLNFNQATCAKKVVNIVQINLFATWIKRVG